MTHWQFITIIGTFILGSFAVFLAIQREFRSLQKSVEAADKFINEDDEILTLLRQKAYIKLR